MKWLSIDEAAWSLAVSPEDIEDLIATGAVASERRISDRALGAYVAAVEPVDGFPCCMVEDTCVLREGHSGDHRQ